MWPRAILHVDMDAFFVNVHLLEHPEDRGRPIAVGGSPQGRGVVASASYEARQFGVRSAMPSSQAIKLCPEIKFVGHNWSMIKSKSQEVMAILERYGPLEKMSVDEAYIDISEHEDPEKMALLIREAVRRESGLPASVGLATSKLVAKVASDFDKPAGCTIVRPGEEAPFLAPLPVRALHGIGPVTATQLNVLGIQTCGDLAAFDLDRLRLTFGRHAVELQERARGIDDRPVAADPEPAKSISQERTFDRDVDDPEILREQLVEMSETVADYLRRRGLVAHTVVVKYRWTDFTTFTRQRTVERAIDSAGEIARLAIAIWEANWRDEKLRLIGVGVTNLEEPAGRQLELF